MQQEIEWGTCSICIDAGQTPTANVSDIARTVSIVSIPGLVTLLKAGGNDASATEPSNRWVRCVVRFLSMLHECIQAQGLRVQ